MKATAIPTIESNTNKPRVTVTVVVTIFNDPIRSGESVSVGEVVWGK